MLHHNQVSLLFTVAVRFDFNRKLWEASPGVKNLGSNDSLSQVGYKQMKDSKNQLIELRSGVMGNGSAMNTDRYCCPCGYGGR